MATLSLHEKLQLIKVNQVRAEIHLQTTEGEYVCIDLIGIVNELCALNEKDSGKWKTH